MFAFIGFVGDVFKKAVILNQTTLNLGMIVLDVNTHRGTELDFQPNATLTR